MTTRKPVCALAKSLALVPALDAELVMFADDISSQTDETQALAEEVDPCAEPNDGETPMHKLMAAAAAAYVFIPSPL